MTKPVALFLLMLVCFRAFSQPIAVNKRSAFPASFILNKGQVKDQLGRPNPNVKFTYSSNGFNLFLNDAGFSMQLIHENNITSSMNEDGSESALSPFSTMPDLPQTMERIDVKFRNANKSAQVIADLPDEGPIHFIKNGSAVHTKSFHRITYKEIYPGIDLVFLAGDKPGQLTPRFEFVLHPGANPERIVMDHAGCSALNITESGAAQLNTSAGCVSFSNLFTFLQSGQKEIPCSFVTTGNRLSFSLTEPVEETTVIDPDITWGTYYGGEKNESNSFDIIRDHSGNLLITGATKSSQQIASTGAYQETYAGGSGDMYLAKFDDKGNRLWSTYFGGTLNDISYAATTDLQNNVYVVGSSASSGLTTAGAFQENQAGNGDNIIAKFDSNGYLLWCTLLGGTKVEQIRGAVCDAAGNIYVAGYTESESGISSPESFDATYNDAGDAFLSKFTSSGQLLWSTYIGGAGQDRAHSLAYDGSYVYAFGTTESDTGMSTAGAHQMLRGGKEDAWLAKFDTSGMRIWSTYFGGAEEDHGRSVKVDSAHHVYIGGFTGSMTGIGTPGTHQPNWYVAYGSGNIPLPDGYVAKFDSNGQQLWGTYYGGEGSDQVVSIDVDKNSNVYCAGSTNSLDSIASKNPMMTFHGFTGEGMLAKLDTAGKRVWGSYFGGWGTDDLWAITSDGGDFIYFIGKTDSSVQTTPGSFQPHNNGGVDAFIFKLYAAKSCYDPFEPNDDASNAAPLVVSTDTFTYGVNASIRNIADQDWYSFTMTSANKYFKIRLTDLDHDYNLKLFRMSGQLLMQAKNTGSQDEIITGRLFANTYNLQVSHAPLEFDSVNCYRLIIMAGNTPFDDSGSRTSWSEEKSSLTVSPNPASDQVQISFYALSAFDGRGELFNASQVKVASLEFRGESGLNFLELPVNQLPSGIYFFVLHTNNEIFREKLIIQKN
ncbi:MAG: SBBP repeat-containing protein [Chitinophagales bacterium]|nr:SBBP repeat-containing protein [Chitinophagales bacterium]